MIGPAKLRDSGNQFIDLLPADEFDLLEPLLQRVKMTIRQTVHQFESEVGHVYFPITALFSLLTVMEEDDPVETATIGKEGFIGVAAALGVQASPHRVICQLAGDSFRIPVTTFLDAMRRGPELTRLVHRYIVFSLRNTGQGIACNALHSVEARASRWLLIIHDQAGRDEFSMTHEFLAFMLGVRRQTVTVVAGALQNAGLISFRRGTMVIRDRAGLEDAACECYESVRKYYDRVVS